VPKHVVAGKVRSRYGLVAARLQLVFFVFILYRTCWFCIILLIEKSTTVGDYTFHRQDCHNHDKQNIDKERQKNEEGLGAWSFE